MKISANFTTEEMTGSSRFPDLVTEWEAMRPSHVVNLTRLVYEFLQPLRREFGRIAVLSGYRNRDLNRAVGGAGNSRHMDALAADFMPMDAAQGAVWDWLVQQRALLVYFDRLCVYTTVTPVTFHVDFREVDVGPHRHRLFRGSPWVELSESEAMALRP